MSAANTDKFKKVARKWTGQIGSGGVPDGTTTTIPLASATGLPTDTAVVATIDRVDANGSLTPAKEETVIGVVSGSDLVNCIRGVEGTAQAHSAGAVVEILITAKAWNDLVNGILAEHNQDGTHADITATSITSSGAITSGGAITATGNIQTSGSLKTDNLEEKTSGNGITVNHKITLLNNIAIQQKDSGGTARNILKVNSSNILELGNSNLLGFQNNLPYADLSSLSRQAIINGAFDVWQRGTSFTPNDDTYTADRWNFLTETNGAWTVAQDTNVPIGFTHSAKFSNVTANNQCAIVQFLEYKDAKKLVGKNVSFSFYAKTVNGEIANLRAAVLSWTGTADSLTSDVIATWASDGTNPTWATNWTMENTPSNLALTNSWTRYTLTANIDTAGTNNIAVIIWVDDGTIAAGDDFWITGVQLNEGLVALPFYPKSYEEEFIKCSRYYYRLNNGGDNYYKYGEGIAGNSTNVGVVFFGSVPFFKNNPTVSWSNLVIDEPGVAFREISSISAKATENQILTNIALSSSTTASKVHNLLSNGTTNSYIAFDFEI